MATVPHLSGGRIHTITDASRDEIELSASYFSAVSHLMATGDTDRLDAFRGRKLRGLPFDIDPDLIEDWQLATDFDFQEIYQP